MSSQNQIRRKIDDYFGRRCGEAADFVFLLCLQRIIAIFCYSNDFISQSQGKEYLGIAGRQRDNSIRLFGYSYLSS